MFSRVLHVTIGIALLAAAVGLGWLVQSPPPQSIVSQPDRIIITERDGVICQTETGWQGQLCVEAP